MHRSKTLYHSNQSATWEHFITFKPVTSWWYVISVQMNYHFRVEIAVCNVTVAILIIMTAF